MDEKSRAEHTLKALRYDFGDFSIQGFIRFVSQARDREIIPIPWEMPPTLFGAWMSDDEEPKEYIFYRNDVPPMHQVHIQLHELSHFLLGHPTLHINRKRIAEVVAKRASFPFADLPRLRSPDKTDLEVQAETLASLIQKQVIRSASLDRLTSDLSSEKKLANFLRTMGLS